LSSRRQIVFSFFKVIQLLSGFRAFDVFDLLMDIIGIGCYLPLRGLIQRIPVLSLKKTLKNMNDDGREQST